MRALRLVGAVIVVTGCGGGGDSGGGGTPPPAAVSSVAITPSTAQSVVAGGTVAFSAQPRDAQGNSLTRTVSWTTSDQTKVSLSATSGATVTATAIAEGSSQIRATSEGIQSTSVSVAVTSGGSFPSTADVSATVSNTFSPATVNIAAGGTVTWTFATTHNVTFVSAKPTGGDIGNTDSGTASRAFPAAGSFPYNCTLHPGMSGTVVVH